LIGNLGLAERGLQMKTAAERAFPFPKTAAERAFPFPKGM